MSEDLKDHAEGGAPSSGIAIVGMAGRFPGARNVAEFWRNLCAGTESISRFTDAELEDSFGAEVRGAANFVKARPILDEVERFDAEFFGMYAREAELTDPQHRLFLECCWEALEDAGYDPAAYRGSIGVFAGSSINTYFLNNVCADRRTIEEFTSNYQVGSYPMLLGAGQDFLSTRVSYKLDLKGPSVTLQTACSTSLLTVAQACQSLLLYQSDMALAGGVSVSFPQKRGYQHLEGGMVSSDGHCRPFDADASGTVFGSGVGVVVLKRLQEALADGDTIYAVIRGSGVNNDGAGKVGFTAPSIQGQAAAIEMALATAGVDARSISYVECHGTATPLGDPIEIAGLSKAFGAAAADSKYCAIGSVKGNVGHLDAAAGITGLIKTALSLKHRILPPSLHYRRPNPQIDFSKTPFFVNAALQPWPETLEPRRAGVSAFGVGGTNVHVIMEEPPAVPAEAANGAVDEAQLLVLSARSATALTQARKNLAAHLREPSALPLADVAYSLQVGRRAFDHRLSIVARNREEALEKLAGREQLAVHSGVRVAADPHVVFMFPGQGAQYLGMGRDLFRCDGEFRRQIERCTDILRPLIGEDLIELIYPAVNSPAAQQRLMSTLSAQPAIFSVGYALANVWMRWGVRPAAMIGHSVGEFVAATLAGVFSLEDALALVAERGRLMQQLPGGAMLAVRLPESEVLPLLTPELTVAAVNGPSLCVISGSYDSVDEFEKSLAALSVGCRRLHTSHAFHSSMIDPIVEPLKRRVQRVQLSPPQIPYVSCVTGDWIRDDQATSPEYWSRHAREPVRFADGIAQVSAAAGAVLIEVGPGNALSTLALQNTRARGIPVVSSMQDAARESDDGECLLDAVGQVWSAGVAPDWVAIHGRARRRVPLPTYPFERSRHWIDPPARAASNSAGSVQGDPLQDNTPNHEGSMNQGSGDSHVAFVAAAIAAIIEELSGEKPVLDASTSFLEMGYDSLFLTQVAQKIQSQMKVKITFRQLLSEYSNVPSLAAFLAEKLPRNAAAPAVTAPAVTATASAARLRASGTPPIETSSSLSSVPAGVESIFRDQLQAMSQLINRQFEMLQSLGGTQVSPPPRAAEELLANQPAAELPASQATPEPSASRFQVYKPAQKSAGSGVSSEQQRRHIDELTTRYTKKTAGSKRLTQVHRAHLADPRAAAGFRTEWKEMVYPIVCASCSGSKLYDVDGNEYIDLVNGFGQTAFGHSPKFVVDAVKDQLDKGFAIGPQADLAGKVAGLISEMTGNERVTFCNTGSEAVMAAMRVARTVTGREKVVVFNGDYHGQFDEVLVKGVQRPGAAPRSMPVAPGIPHSAVENMVVLEYATPHALQWLRDNAQDLAAVVIEPVQSRHPDLQPLEFLREVRDITEASGAALVLDEVVTGFRVHPGGIQALAGVRADMATYGKVLGGGLPIGILAGKAKFMDALDGGQWNYGDDSFPEVGVTFFAGTFVRHPLVLAATWAVLNHLKEHGPRLQEQLSQRTGALVERLRALFAERGVATKIESYSSWFYFNFHNEHPLAGLFFYHLRYRGIHVHEGFPCFLTTAHSDADIEKIFTAFRDSLDELQSVGILSAPLETKREVAESQAQVPLPTERQSLPQTTSESVPLTESQLEIWLAAQMGDDASCAFNESLTLRMQGELNLSALEAAVNQVIARHDALRATFSPTGEEMRISPPQPFHYPVTDLSYYSLAEAERAESDLLDRDARTPFDLIKGPVVRAHLVKLGSDLHAFTLTAHHIVCDGWSINVIVDELAQIYSAACRGEALKLKEALPFSSFALAQAARDPKDLAKTEAFWLDQFKTPPPPLELPTDRARPRVKSFRGASRCRRIDAKLTQAIKKAGARHGSTLFVTLLAAFQALMGRLADQDTVVVGVPTAGQSLLEDQILVGHCVNFLPIRGGWSAETKVSEYLAATAKRVVDAYEHQDYTFGTLVRKLSLPREAGRLPLAEIQFNLERLTDRMELPNLNIQVDPNAKAYVNFDLFLNVNESADGLRMDCDYNTDLFNEATVDHWLECYQALLESMIADAAQPLCAASCLPPADRELLAAINDTSADYPKDRGVHQLIEAQASERPSAIAARFGDVSLTYEALNERANRLANVLRERIKGPKSGRLIGVSIDRSLDMLIALIAVWKAGCAYVPLDPLHPAARLRYILAEAEVAALITDATASASLVADGTPLIDMRRDAAAIDAASSASPPAIKRPARTTTAEAGAVQTGEALAYVIYTSGSTGLPKGVEVTHRSVVNLLCTMAREPGLKEDDIFFAVTTISFDIACLEIFLPLIVGARVVIAERDAVIDGFKLLAHLDSSGATAMQATPSTWRLLLEAGFRARSGFKMWCGGEGLPLDLAGRLLESGGELWNMYGPTETTIWSSCTHLCAGTEPITVGGPTANTQFYVLDRHDQPLPLGVPGQLHIGGDGVARGYHLRPQLTDEKFVANPFTAGRMYRTGDLARWLSSGKLEILGRIDHQVKLRGFRIELGEIEAVLLQKARLAAAAVILREDTPGAPRLVAYYVDPAADEARSPAELRALLAAEIPEYMLPTAWVRLDALPLSPNGKLDRAALPVPDVAQTAKEDFVAPKTETELVLTQIFSEVLHLEPLGATADLLKLGADSIQLFQITARANRRGLKITARQLLQHRSAAGLAAVIDGGNEVPASPQNAGLPTLAQFKRNRRAGAAARS